MQSVSLRDYILPGKFSPQSEKFEITIAGRKETFNGDTPDLVNLANIVNDTDNFPQFDVKVGEPYQDKETMTDATAASTKTTETEAPKTETITTEGTMVPGTPIKTMDTTEEFPVEATRITGDFDKAFPLEREKLDLKLTDVQKLNNDAESSFAKNIVIDRGGFKSIPPDSKYLKGYDEKIHKDRVEYAMKRYKQAYIADILGQYNKSVSETQVSSNFAIPEGTKVSDIVIQAREKISQIDENPSMNDDQKEIYIEQIKTIVSEQLNNMNIEPSKFGF